MSLGSCRNEQLSLEMMMMMLLMMMMLMMMMMLLLMMMMMIMNHILIIVKCSKHRPMLFGFYGSSRVFSLGPPRT